MVELRGKTNTCLMPYSHLYLDLATAHIQFLIKKKILKAGNGDRKNFKTIAKEK